MKEIFPARGLQAPSPLGRSSGLARQAPAESRASTRSGGSSTAAGRSSSIRPTDLSCYWNQCERSPQQPGGHRSRSRSAENVIDYATGREMPADKLTLREVHNRKAEPPKRGALRIAKLMHAGDWNIARQAIPNLMDVLRRPPYNFDVVLDQKDLFARDPSLVYYPLIYIHGRASLSFPKEDLDALRSHLDPGGGTLFADAACGSPAFDASFRRFVTELLPDQSPGPDPAATTSSTPSRSAPTFPRCSTPRRPAAASTSLSSRACGSTTTGPSSIRNTTSAALSSATPASSARATPTKAPSRSPATSSSTRRFPDSGRRLEPRFVLANG